MYIYIYDRLQKVPTFRRTFSFCFRSASVLLPFSFRCAGKPAKYFQRFQRPLELFFGKPNLPLECLQTGPLSKQITCFRFAFVFLPFCFHYASKVMTFRGFQKCACPLESIFVFRVICSLSYTFSCSRKLPRRFSRVS